MHCQAWQACSCCAPDHTLPHTAAPTKCHTFMAKSAPPHLPSPLNFLTPQHGFLILILNQPRYQDVVESYNTRILFRLDAVTIIKLL